MTLEEQLEIWFNSNEKVYILFKSFESNNIFRYKDILTTDVKGLMELKLTGLDLEKHAFDNPEFYLDNYFIPEISYSNWSKSMIEKYSLRMDYDFECYIIKRLK